MPLKHLSPEFGPIGVGGVHRLVDDLFLERVGREPVAEPRPIVDVDDDRDFLHDLGAWEVTGVIVDYEQYVDVELEEGEGRDVVKRPAV